MILNLPTLVALCIAAIWALVVDAGMVALLADGGTGPAERLQADGI